MARRPSSRSSVDAAGNWRTVSDSITLDTICPDVRYFAINNGAPYAWTTAATLNWTVTGATQMRFLNPEEPWTQWFAYSDSPLSWTIAAEENTNSPVWAEFKDAAGNVTSAYDVIYYDAIRILRFTAREIEMTNDSDAGDNPGEIFWDFRAVDTYDTGFAIYNQAQTPEWVVNEGVYDFNDMTVTRAMSNNPEEWYMIFFTIYEDDGLLGVQSSGTVSATFQADDPEHPHGIGAWILGTTGLLGPQGKMHFLVAMVD